MLGNKKYITLLLLFAASFNLFAQHTDEKLAAQYFAAGEFDKAVVIYEKLYNENPSHFNYNSFLNCLFELEDYRKAERLVKKQQDLNPGNYRYEVEMGYVFIRSGNTDKADRHFDRMIRRLPYVEDDIHEIADAFIVRGLFERASATYLRARRNAGERGIFAFELANIYERMGKHEEMINEYMLRIDNDPHSIDDVQNRMQMRIANDISGNFTRILRESILDRIQRNSSNLLYPQMLYWLSIQLKDFEMALVQAKSLDRRMKTDGELVYNLASIMTANKEYDFALDAYEHLMNKGRNSLYYLGAKVRWLDVKFLKITSTPILAEADIKLLAREYKSTLEEFGRNNSTLPLMRNLAHLQAFYLNQSEEAVQLMESALKIHNTPALEEALNKLSLADVYLSSGEVWEASLLYSQVEKAFKNDTIGHYAKFRNARLSFYIGEFDWALAQLDVLRSATSKLIANDAMELSLIITDNIDWDSSYAPLEIYARAELAYFQRRPELAMKLLDSVLSIFPGHIITDDVLYRKAVISIQNNDYKGAAAHFQRIIDEYYQDVRGDYALFRLAELYDRPLNDKARAAELYRQLIIDFPGSLFAHEARIRFRKINGKENQIP